MAFPRKHQGFTLTEVLMAAGILGIGLTMVASIFPVAVDQSRRSQDQTMAALCARSVMARVRADRNAILNGLRGKTDPTLYLNSDLGSSFPTKHTIYRPSLFLYNPDSTKDRSYDGIGAWDAGNYVARLFATRIGNDGPWRIVIFVCRSIGRPPNNPDQDQWTKAATGSSGYVVGPGTYVFELARYNAMGYLIDYVKPDKKGYFAVDTTVGGFTYIQSNSTAYQCIPDTVAVFHTMLGE